MAFSSKWDASGIMSGLFIQMVKLYDVSIDFKVIQSIQHNHCMRKTYCNFSNNQIENRLPDFALDRNGLTVLLQSKANQMRIKEMGN